MHSAARAPGRPVLTHPRVFARLSTANVRMSSKPSQDTVPVAASTAGKELFTLFSSERKRFLSKSYDMFFNPYGALKTLSQS